MKAARSAQNLMGKRPVTTSTSILQRKCACGTYTFNGSECAGCKKKGSQLQRSATTHDEGQTAPPIVHEVLRSPGQPLDTATRAFFEPRFDYDFSGVRLHTDARSADSARSVNAHAYTVGKDVVFASGKYAPMTDKGRQLLAHELAHVVQQQYAVSKDFASALTVAHYDEMGEQQAHDAMNRALAPPGAHLGFAVDAVTPIKALSIQRLPDNLTAYPERERRQIRVSVIPIALPSDLPDMFTAPRGSTTGNPSVSYSVNGTVVYGATVPTAPPILRLGLASIGGWLADHTNALPLNSTITLAINLTPYGGTNARFRFTYFAHTEHRRTSNVMLIENLGAAGTAPASAAATAGTFSVRGQNFTLASGWTNNRFALLRQALELMPDVALREAAGITFYQRGRGTPNEAGRYLSAQDAVELHDNAFPTSAARFGDVQSAVRAAAHELGHVLDSRRMERAWRTFNQAGQTRAARRTLLHQRSLSGLRYQAPAQASGTYTLVEAATAIRSIEFRRAAQQDGAAVTRGGSLSGGVTEYSNTDWEEYFAEAFSIYVTDPRTLEQLRPHVFQYFRRHFPLPARGGGQGAPSGPGAQAGAGGHP